MCLSPITIINPSKYVSLQYRHRYLLQVPCGHCAECATNKANEWYYRSYYHTLDTLSHSGHYIIFDTLTYSNKYLPHLSDFVSVPDGCDFPCFSRKNVQLFLKRLRRYCDKFDSKFSFFLTSEYGTSERCTHRPHHHILFYCDGNVSPLEMSRLISKAWIYGRTDGVKYKGSVYAMKNVFSSGNFSESLRTCRYVSKYIQKSCKFQKEINARLDAIMTAISDHFSDGWLDSVHAKRVRLRYSTLVNQFHSQSLGYGAIALRDMDIKSIIDTGVLNMPDSRKVHLSIPIPMYFKRKLFYEVIQVDGSMIWCPTELGRDYLISREKRLFNNLVARFVAKNHQCKVNFDADKLADYVLFKRGRIKSDNFSYDPLDIISTCSYYNYVTPSDREHLDKLGLSFHYIGNNFIGYRSSFLYGRIRFKDFIDKHVYIDDDLEEQLRFFDLEYAKIDSNRQQAFELRQHLVNLYHHIGLS